MFRQVHVVAFGALLAVMLFATAPVVAQITWYVDDDAELGGDGTTWDTAFRFVQDALEVAGARDELRVAGGMYKPDRDEDDPNTVTPGDREATFQLVSGVGLYGGYRGIDPNHPGDPDDRDVNQFVTILSGDLLGNDGPDFANYEENSYHVVTAIGVDETTVLDGLTVSAGCADGSGGLFKNDVGAGLYLDTSSPAIVNCCILANLADAADSDEGGGGVYCAGDGEPIFTTCSIVGNDCGQRGAGLYATGSRISLAGCTVAGNAATGWPGMGGGACCVNGGVLCLTDCEVADNSARAGGAGIGAEGGCLMLQACTVTGNRRPTYGAGVYCVGGALTLGGCAVSENEAAKGGGGVYLSEATGAVSYCEFRGNKATGVHQSAGGAVECDQSSATITDCNFSENHAVITAGAMFVYESSPTVADCSFVDNWASGRSAATGSGAVDNTSNSLPVFLRCVFRGNSGNLGGAAGNYYDSDATFIACEFRENAAAWPSTLWGGGALGNMRSDPTLINCVFVNNRSDALAGGAIYNDYASPCLVNCTFMGNWAPTLGGALYWDEGGDGPAVVSNCVFWDNFATAGPDIAMTSWVEVQVSHSDVHGGTTAVHNEAGLLTWGEGNIDSDPLFAFPDDAHLRPGSPCIDAGTNEPPGGLPAADGDGNPRAVDGDGDGAAEADMGAYESVPDTPTIAVTPAFLEFVASVDDPQVDAAGLSVRNAGGSTLDWEIEAPCAWLDVDPSSGESAGEVDDVAVTVDPAGLMRGTYTSVLNISDPLATNSPRAVQVMLHVYRTLRVPDEYPTIQEAIDAAEFDGDVVVLADGVYSGPGNHDLDFNGRNITVASAHGPDKCIIDCEGAGRGFCFHNAETDAATVRGLTITNGSAVWGGAVLCQDWGIPTIADCVLTGNTASNLGGAIACRDRTGVRIEGCTIADNEGGEGGGVGIDTWAVMRMANCTIQANTADLGGGVSCRGPDAQVIVHSTLAGNFASSGGGLYSGARGLLASDCVLMGNAATVEGGGARVSGLRACLTHCTIVDNTAENGGGLYLPSCAGLFDSCVIAQNAALSEGAGILCHGGSPALRNCTIADNEAATYGGGLLVAHAQANARNCILWANSATAGPQIALVSEYSTELALGFSDVEGGAGAVHVDPAGTLYWLDGNFDADPRFTDPLAADYRLTGGSPAIDAGDNAAVPLTCASDRDGNPRFVDDSGMPDAGSGTAPIVDLGAFEFQGTTCFGDLDGDGEVGLTDLVIVIQNYGHVGDVTYSDGDLDRDGDVDLSDLGILLAMYGATCP